MTHAPEILLSHHLKTLKLPTFLREHEKVARQCATEGLDHVQYLKRLVELELKAIASPRAERERPLPAPAPNSPDLALTGQGGQS